MRVEWDPYVPHARSIPCLLYLGDARGGRLFADISIQVPSAQRIEAGAVPFQTGGDNLTLT